MPRKVYDRHMGSVPGQLSTGSPLMSMCVRMAGMARPLMIPKMRLRRLISVKYIVVPTP